MSKQVSDTEDIDGGILQRIERIKEKNQESKEIKKKERELESKKENDEDIDEQFGNVYRVLEDIDNLQKKLVQWVYLGREMGVEIDEGEINEKLGETEESLGKIKERSFDDFSEVGGVSSLREELGDHKTELTNILGNVEQSVIEECDSWTQKLNRTKTANQIPDIGGTGNDDAIENAMEFLNEVKNGSLPENASERWVELRDKYESVETARSLESVQDKYNLSDESLEVMEDFLNSETVRLSEIDPDVLSDLRQFQEFSEQLEINFTSNNK